MLCTRPVFLDRGMFDCGRCQSCQQKKRIEWTLRMSAESLYWQDRTFLTLTYNNHNLPENGSLSKRDVQLFLKRLRYYLKGRKIKYYCAGEYGGERGRPHYHLILFGISPRDKKYILQSWSKGFIDVQMCTEKTIRYATKYIQKQTAFKGREGLNNLYRPLRIEPPFRLVSTGLGLRYMLDNFKQLRKELCVRFNGFKAALPRYWRRFMFLTEDHFQPMIAKKQQFLETFLKNVKLSFWEDRHYKKYGLDNLINFPSVKKAYLDYLKVLEHHQIVKRYEYGL